MKKILCAVLLPLLLAACTNQPLSTSHQHVTSDGRHWAVQVSMSTGVQGTPVQTVMVVYNQYSRTPLAIVNGNSLRLSDQLLQAFLNLGPSVVAGQYQLEAARLDCPPGTLCGTLVQVSNNAGANAGATATSNLTN